MAAEPERHIYKTFAEAYLDLFAFAPERRAGLSPAIIFFHGSAWATAGPEQFFPQCERLAQIGVLSMSVRYRLGRARGSSPLSSIVDGRSAMRWVRSHAQELGIDPDKIAAGGGAGGAHVAACCALIEGFDDAQDDREISPVPNALVLFNPVLDTSHRQTRFGKRAKALSPLHHIRSGGPPCIIFHGTDDTVAPFLEAQQFEEVMKRSGNECELVPFVGKEHAFFNYGRDDNVSFERTIEEITRFFQEIGFIEGPDNAQ